MKASLERDSILLVLSGLLLAACDKGSETPTAEPKASASAAAQSEATAQPEAMAATSAPVEAKEVSPGTSASAGGKEKKCSPGGCSPGACG